MLVEMIQNGEFDFVQALIVSGVGLLVVMFELALLACLVTLLSKAIRGFEGLAGKKKKAEPSVAPAKAQGTPLPGNVSAGSLDLDGLDEPTAAVIMALVSHQTGIDLNR
ncbi:MAG TPA: hypothetical protein DDY98_09445, partial [Ruminococcaceae bacterium]|nr:hypothetical protein [Oscillospiraceae bacterium]